MPISKDRISSPLEAGPSLLEMKRLPHNVTSALDYVSSRLARKRVHLSVIVVRQDIDLYNLPASLQQSRTSSAIHLTNPKTPARSLFSGTSLRIAQSLSSHSSTSSLSDSASSAPSTPSSAYFSSKSELPGLPSSPQNWNPKPQPLQPISLLETPKPPLSINSYGITLMQTTALTVKAEKILRRTIQKAEKRFEIGYLPHSFMKSTSQIQRNTDLISQIRMAIHGSADKPTNLCPHAQSHHLFSNAK